MNANAETGAPSPELATHYRTHTCGALRLADVGQEVRLAGAVDRSRGERDLDLRDAYGVTRVRLSKHAQEVLLRECPEGPGGEAPSAPSPETIVAITGTVEARVEPNAALATGEIRVRASKAEVLSHAKAPLIYDFRDPKLTQAERIRHRYVYLRKRSVHEAFAFRTRLALALRRALRARRFVEVDTPVLAHAWSPAYPEAFLAIRGRAQIFALPGPRPPHAELMNACGFDRAFEFGRRFRRQAAYGPFEQPEYTVLDIQMAYAAERDLYALEDALIACAWALRKGAEPDEPPPAIVELTHREARERYGSDCPDVRFGLELADATPCGAGTALDALRAALAPGSALVGFVVRKGAARMERIEAALAAIAPTGAGAAASTLAWLAIDDAEAPGEVAAAASPKPAAARGAGRLDRKAGRALGARSGDVVVLASGPDAWAATALAGQARAACGKALRLARAGSHAFVRVTELPYFTFDLARKAWALVGDPLALPFAADLDDDPRRMRMRAHRLALDGLEIGGGSLRAHDLRAQRRVLDALGLSNEDVDQRFGRLLAALRYGAPPRGRLAIGFDRLVARCLGLGSIDEVIALPKLPDGSDPLARSPWPIDNGVVRGLLGL